MKTNNIRECNILSIDCQVLEPVLSLTLRSQPSKGQKMVMATREEFENFAMNPHSQEYHEIKQALLDRFVLHSKEYSWTPNDVLRDTITLVCPRPYLQAWVLAKVVKDFLNLKDHPQVHQGHGLPMKPGWRLTNDKQVETIVSAIEDDKHYWRLICEEFPKEFEKLSYSHNDGYPAWQRWSYNIEHQWNHMFLGDDGQVKSIRADQDTTLEEFEPYEVSDRRLLPSD